MQSIFLLTNGEIFIRFSKIELELFEKLKEEHIPDPEKQIEFSNIFERMYEMLLINGNYQVTEYGKRFREI